MTGTNSQVAGGGHTVDEHGCAGETDSGSRTGVTSTTGSIAGRGHMTVLHDFAREGVGVVRDEVTFTTSSCVAGYGHLVTTQEVVGVVVDEEIRAGDEGEGVVSECDLGVDLKGAVVVIRVVVE